MFECVKRRSRTARLRVLWLAFCIWPVSTSVTLKGLGQAVDTQAAANIAASEKVSPRETQYSEHWNVLSLSGNTLEAAAPLVGEIDTMPGFTRELIQVQWRPRDPIDLYIIRPADVLRPPVVLLLYGYPSETDRFRDNAYCKALVSHGFAAVGFVSAYTGQRYHDLPMKDWFVSKLPESLGRSVHDVQMVLDYLATRNDLDLQRVGMYGQGSGGTIAALAASVDARITAVDILDPWGDWPDWLAMSPLVPNDERPNYLAHTFLSSVAPLDPVDILGKLEPHRLRLQQTLFSEVTPPVSRERIRTATPVGSTFLQYKDLAEYKSKANDNANIFDWLQERLNVRSTRRDLR